MVEVNYRFPLVLWEQTNEYRQQLQVAQIRFGEFSDVTVTSNCIPVVFKSTDTPYYEQRGLSAAGALASAKRYGAAGYFKAEELEAFRKGKGVIVEMEMEELGFRRHKKDALKWARRQRSEESQPEIRIRHWEELYGTSYDIPDDEERDRLRGLKTNPSLRTDLGKTYSVSTGRTGLIFVALDANPFAGHSTERIGELGRQLAQRAHINREQNGFVMEARNVKLDDIAADDFDAVHVKAKRPDGRVEEVVWPATTHAQTIIDLAVDLRQRATGGK